MEEQTLFGMLRVYRERGRFLGQREMFDKAIESYNLAANEFPEDVPTLLGRSKIAGDARRPSAALADAEAALDLENFNLNAKYMQAKSMYSLCEFEKSLIYFSRGLRVRKKPPYFAEGIVTAEETIHDCVGKKAGRFMINFLQFIKKHKINNTEKKYETSHGPKRVSRMPPPVRVVMPYPHIIIRHNNLARVMAMKYLGPMAEDKFFLKSLQTDQRIMSANANGSIQLLSLVNNTYGSLAERQEILRTRRPYYSVKFREAKPTNKMIKDKEKLIISKQIFCENSVLKLLDLCEKAAAEKNIENLVRLTKRTHKYIEAHPKTVLLKKDLFFEILYRHFAKGYLEQYRLSYELGKAVNRRRIRILMGMPGGRAMKHDPVLFTRHLRQGDIEGESIKLRALIPVTPISNLRCFMLHELASLLVCLKEYSRAKYYATRCQKGYFQKFYMTSLEDRYYISKKDTNLVFKNRPHSITIRKSEIMI